MKKSILLAVVVVGLSVLAQDEATNAEITKELENPAILAEFEEPDGAAISVNEDGSFVIFGRGTGAYDIDDVDDVSNAKAEAVLKAKATIAKFLNEKLSTEEGLTEAVNKVKKATSNGNTQTVDISKETIKTIQNTIKNSAEALLKGAITLKIQKIARKGTSGEIQATVVISSKTQKVADMADSALSPTERKHEIKGGNSSWIQTSKTDF